MEVHLPSENKNEKIIRETPPVFGIFLIFTVFILILLFSFSAFSLSSAKQSYEKSFQRGDRRKAYYEAANKAEVILSEINEDGKLPEDKTSTFHSTKASNHDKIASGDRDTSQNISYTVPVDDKSELSVTLMKDKNSDYQVTSFKLENIDDWNIEPLKLFDPNMN